MRIFICYRRENAAGHAGRLYDQLAARFGSDNVFMDVTGIEPGEDFVSVVEETLARSDAVLVVIGPGWLTSSGDDGLRRIDQTDDYLRREIAGALARGCQVIPVLVMQASMPQPNALPAPIADLGRRNAIELRDAHWRSDVDSLVRFLHVAVPEQRKEGPLGWVDPSTWSSLPFEWIFCGFAALLVIAGYFDAWINRHLPVKTWEHAPVQGAWLLVTICLGTAMTIRWLRTRRIDVVIPRGYLVSVIGCVLFPVGVLSGIWWTLLFGDETAGVPAIFRPPNLLQVLAGALIVLGPFRASIARRELRLGPTGLISAALLFAVITFFSQFDHPYVNPWAYDRHQLPPSFGFIGEELGPLSLMMQATIVTGTVLFVLRQVHLPPGGITFMLTSTAVLVCWQLGNFQFILVAAVVGVLADLLLLWARPSPDRMPQLRAVSTALGGLLATVYLLEVWIREGTYWPPDVVFGTIFVCATIGWLMSYILFAGPATADAAAVLWPRNR